MSENTIRVELPSLGEDVEQATISVWLKQVGDSVTAGEPLIEVSTDKVDTEVPSPADGKVVEILADEDSVVDVGQAIAVIRSAPTIETTPIEPPRIEKREEQSVPPAPPAPVSAPTGKGRAITEKLSRLRKLVAARMVESLQTSAQLTTVVEVDVSAVAAARTRANATFVEEEGIKLSFLPFFAKAALDALQVYPKVNSTIDMAAGTVTYPGAEHLGIAVDTDRGLFVPVIRDAGELSIREIARAIADLAERTRSGSISPDELSGGTFTITNTGSRGALFDTPIINQPQVAILGTGGVVKRSVVLTDEFGRDSTTIRPMVYLALTYDHRIVDGADAARFLTHVKAWLEEGRFDIG